MSIDKPATDQSESRPFVALDKNQYAQLTTYRKTGVGVATPVWFANANNIIYVITPGTTGKLKRIRNNGCATLAACKANGRVFGESIECTARILSAQEQDIAESTLARKYGLLYRIYTGFQKLRRVQGTYIAIQPVQF